MVLGVGVAGVELNPGGCCSWAIAALLAGWLAGTLTRGRGFGCIGDILLGLIGAAVGVLALSLLQIHLPSELGFLGTAGVAFLGAFLLALLGRLIGGSQQRPQYPDWNRSRGGGQ